jgi:hypothetical protein
MKKIKKNETKRNETLFFNKRNETERYFLGTKSENRNEINIFQKRNEKNVFNPWLKPSMGSDTKA